MNFLKLGGLCMALCLGVSGCKGDQLSESQALSREELFKASDFAQAKISPNGKKILYVGRSGDGQSNLFLKANLSQQEAKQVSFFDSPGIIQFFWSANSTVALVLKDEDGRGAPHLYGIDTETGELKCYTKKYGQVVVKVYHISEREDKVLLGINSRVRQFHDVYLLDLITGELTLKLKNDSFMQFLIGDDLNIALKMRANSDGSWEIYRHGIESQGGPRKSTFIISAKDMFQMDFLRYDSAKEELYVLDARDPGMNALKRISFKEDKSQVLGRSEISDIDDVFFIGNDPCAWAEYGAFKKWHVIDKRVQKDFSVIEEQLGDMFEVINTSRDGTVWLVATNLPNKGKEFWVYSRAAHKLTALYAQKSMSYAKMYPLVVKSQDGLDLVGYYTLPLSKDCGGYVKKPIPFVAIPHGGPFKVRDKYSFNPLHQWLAGLGYGVVCVNFRLSSGFGKDFVAAGNGQWGKKAHQDVIDAVQACIDKRLADKDKLAIFGGSYGGYEALASLVYSPDFYRCGVSMCGPSNLRSVLKGVPPYWDFPASPLSDKKVSFTKQAFITSMGADPDELEWNHLDECSPVHYVSHIKKPLLLIHGRNDPIVVESESEKIYKELCSQGKEVIYWMYPDEGHGIAKFVNKMQSLAAIEVFLAKELGGACHPVDKKTADEATGVEQRSLKVQPST